MSRVSSQSIQDQRRKWTLRIQAEKSAVPGTSAAEAKPLSQHQETGSGHTGQTPPRAVTRGGDWPGAEAVEVRCACLTWEVLLGGSTDAGMGLYP